MKLPQVLLSSLLLTLSLPLLAADNLLQNGDFEEGQGSWSTFVPTEAQESGATWALSDKEVHGGSQAGEMSCTQDARFALLNFVKGHDFSAGKRYKVTAWVKAGSSFVPQSGTPGYAIRVSMFADGGGDGGLFYLGTGNKAVAGPDTRVFNDQDLPKDWTKLEGVFQVNPGTARVNVCLFIWKGTGSLFLDDVSLEEVDDSVPLTPTE
jgi:hypothetical protein